MSVVKRQKCNAHMNAVRFVCLHFATYVLTICKMQKQYTVTMNTGHNMIIVLGKSYNFTLTQEYITCICNDMVEKGSSLWIHRIILFQFEIFPSYGCMMEWVFCMSRENKYCVVYTHNCKVWCGIKFKWRKETMFSYVHETQHVDGVMGVV